VVPLLGARRVGKTILLHQFLDEISGKEFLADSIPFLNGDDIYTRQFLES